MLPLPSITSLPLIPMLHNTKFYTIESDSTNLQSSNPHIPTLQSAESHNNASNGTAHPLLSVCDLEVSYAGIRALSGVSVTLNQGGILGIVGESGSGKSTFLRAIAHLLPKVACIEGGSIQFAGEDITHASEATMQTLRGSELAYLFQNGELSLDPLFSVDYQFNEVLHAHAQRMSCQEKTELLSRMGIANASHVLQSIPSELSGGQCQRVALAFALAGKPKLLLADEPTSALDVQAQEQVAALLRSLNETYGMSILLVGHDIEFVASLASRIAVMKQGCIVECASTTNIMNAPQQAYTQELLAAIPKETRTFVSVGKTGAAALLASNERYVKETRVFTSAGKVDNSCS